MSTVEVFVEVPEDENLEVLRDLFRATICEEPKQITRSGFTGVEVLIVFALAKGFSSLLSGLKREWSHGVVVDARGDQIVTSRSEDIPRGDILVIGKDGEHSQLHAPDDRTIAELISRVIPAAKERSQ
jgi:hypothetical protein